MDADKLDEFCNCCDLTNLIDTETECTKNQKPTVDLFLTNRPLCFQKTTATGFSDYHKLISTFFKSHYTCLKPKIIYYKNYKSFNEELFLKIFKIRTFQLTLTIHTRTILISHNHFLTLSNSTPRWKRRFSDEIMHLLSTQNLGKKYVSVVVWETNFGKIYLKKPNSCLRLKERNASHCEENALNHTFKMLLRKVLSQTRHSEILLNLFWPAKAAIHKMI